MSTFEGKNVVPFPHRERPGSGASFGHTADVVRLQDVRTSRDVGEMLDDIEKSMGKWRSEIKRRIGIEKSQGNSFSRLMLAESMLDDVDLIERNVGRLRKVLATKDEVSEELLATMVAKTNEMADSFNKQIQRIGRLRA